MAFLILPNRARKQPAKQTPLNQKHWLAKDATFAMSGVAPVYNAALDKRVVSLTQAGSGWVQRGTQAGYSLYTPDGGWADIGLNQDWSGQNTIIALCRVNSIDGTWGGLFSKDSSGASTQFGIGRYNFSDSLYGSVDDSTAVSFGGSSIPSLVDFSVIAFTHSGASFTGMSYYLNGALSGTTSALAAQPSGSGVLGLGRSRDQLPAYDSDVDWLAFVRFKRVLEAGEVAEFSRNFWELWEPESRRILFFPSGGSVTGVVAYTNADDTSSASGTTTVIGSVSATNANDTVSASGSPVIVGNLAVSNADDSVSASGSVGGAVSGSVSYTNADDTASATGATTVVGSISVTNADDSVAASGTTTVIGSIAASNANDTVSASGTVEEIEVTGTVSVTNADDSVAASGTTTILGSLSYSNKNDTTSASGLVNNGTLVESTLTTGIAQSIRIKKPGIPVNTPEWLRTILEIIVGRRNNKITVPAFQELTFSATPTKAECEALYSYVNQVRSSLESLINRFDS